MNVVHRYPTLYPGQLVKRYKRFLCDVKMGDEMIVCYLANPGSMLGMCVAGAPVRLSKSDSKTRKYLYTVEAVKKLAKYGSAAIRI